MRRQLAVLTLVAIVCGCGSPSVSKKENSTDNSANGSTNSSVNVSPNNTPTNNTPTNNVTPTNNAPTNNVTPTNASTNNTSTNNTSTNNTNPGGECVILTSDSDGSYCNLQATCDESSLHVECILEDQWYCYCGETSLELAQDPCGDPEKFAPELAADCATSTPASMNQCEPTASDKDEYDCDYTVACADEHAYTVGCYFDEASETAQCDCFVDDAPQGGFTIEGNTCLVGDEDLSWWNAGCEWDLSYAE